ncbi:unnamed protein product [Prorocentrum cordatum]|uniref:Uncharacterized protein n=1 Tax=Prorocentrum cordatum TaxID=2364126 RepID=A0ABN9SQY2_9DINO|nr:unnamed protein product [Polarella glacialis]
MCIDTRALDENFQAKNQYVYHIGAKGRLPTGAADCLLKLDSHVYTASVIDTATADFLNTSCYVQGGPNNSNQYHSFTVDFNSFNCMTALNRVGANDCVFVAREGCTPIADSDRQRFYRASSSRNTDGSIDRAACLMQSDRRVDMASVMNALISEPHVTTDTGWGTGSVSRFRGDWGSPATFSIPEGILGIQDAKNPEDIPRTSPTGYCVVTDQTTMSRPTVEMYLDDPSLFEGRFNRDAPAKAVRCARQHLSGLVMRGPALNWIWPSAARRVQIRIYQGGATPAVWERLLTGAGYLYSGRAGLAVFGEVVKRVDKTNSLGPVPEYRHEGGLTHEAMEHVRDLSDPVVVKAIDACKTSRVELPTPAPPEVAGSALSITGPAGRVEDASKIRLLNAPARVSGTAAPTTTSRTLREGRRWVPRLRAWSDRVARVRCRACSAEAASAHP